jgi:transcriptional regulator with XRE-family HTH domain
MRLRKIRLTAGLAQLEVSKELGYSTTQFISNWERGLSYPPIKTVYRLAGLYKVSPEKLYQIIEEDIVRDISRSLAEEFRNCVEP